MAKLKQLLELIINGEVLPASYLDHPLKGDWRGCLARFVTARISNQIGC
jgi:mRNA-degrading endonuclease YafQ of YafQ-DinJ toxin-antitoxin module